MPAEDRSPAPLWPWHSRVRESGVDLLAGFGTYRLAFLPPGVKLRAAPPGGTFENRPSAHVGQFVEQVPSSSRRYPPELRERAVRMVAATSDQHASEWAAMSELARLLGVRRTKWCAT
jgi:hypothetical protein